jgi:hypothetical protein
MSFLAHALGLGMTVGATWRHCGALDFGKENYRKTIKYY